MQVLVTGGAGFIGSHLVDELLAQGHRVRVLDNLSTGKLNNLPLGKPGLEFIQGDIRDAAIVREAMGEVDAVVHLAAVASVQASVDDPVGTHQSNFDGTLHVLEAARQEGVERVVYASSAAVYGDTQVLPVSEGVRLNPLTPYAADKLAGEYYLGAYYRQYGLKSVAFRFFNIYGPRQDPGSPYSGVISIFADRARAGQPVAVYGDGEQTRDFVYVGDLVRLLYQALVLPDPGLDVINIGGGRGYSLLTLLVDLEDLTGHPIARTHVAARAGDIRHSRADVTLLRQRLGWVPQTTLRDGLRKLLDL